MKGLDISRLKKVSSDEKSTTFAHQNGHTLKVAHSGLSPKLLKELSSLPIHKAAGGDTEPNPQPTDDGPEDDQSDQSQPQQNMPKGVNININTQPSPQGPPQPQTTPTPIPSGGLEGKNLQNYVAENPGPVATTGNNPNNPGPGLDAKAVDPASPEVQSPEGTEGNNVSAAETSRNPASVSPAQDQQAFDAPMQSPPQYAHQAVKQELTDEDQKWQQDLSNGHIEPQTYAGLFAKKDTLGKIGTLFGMLLSGAGSGLSHQPNALLGMMQKQIDNDLEAQKQSKDNAQNYLRLNQQNLMNQAGVRATNVDTQSKAFALSQGQMLQASYHNLTMKVDKMPEGPQKEAAKQQLGIIYSKIGQQINNINDQAAGAAAYNQLLFGGQDSGGSGGEQAFQRRDTGMRMLGKEGENVAQNMEQKHFPGLKGQASIPLSGDDREQLNSGITFDQKLQRFMDWTQKHSGDVNPKERRQGEAMAAELQGAYRQATHGGVYKEGEQNFISKLIDSTPTKFFNSIRVLPQLKAISEENKSRVDQLAKSKGFQGYQTTQSEKQPQNSSASSGEIRYDSKGNAWKLGPNGKPVRVQ